MNHTLARRDLAIWFVIALAVRTALALPQQQPGYMDAAYYYDVAEMLASGHGLTENFAWNYLTHPRALPQPSNAYWMPLTSFVVAPFLWLAGDTFRAAQVPMVLLAAALPPLSYALSMHLFSRRVWAWHTAALMLASSFYAPLWGVTDSFALYAVIGIALLWMLSLLPEGTVRGRVLTAFAAGILIALAHLTRADGMLWLAPALISCLRLERAYRTVLALLAGYAALILPWLARSVAEFGAPLAGGALFVRSYDDLFFYERPLTYAYWAGAGIDAIAQSVGRAVLLNLATVAAATSIIYLPFVLLAAWRARATRIVALGLLYLGVLYAVLSLAFAAVSWRGTMLHSLTGVLPLLYALAPAGLSYSIAYVSARRQTWNPVTAERVFATAFLVLSFASSAWYYVGQISGSATERAWNDRQSEYRLVAAWTSGSSTARAPVMCVNPPMYNYLTGGAAVAIPSDGIDSLLAAARQFEVRYLVLESDHPRALRDLFAAPASDPRFALRAEFANGPGEVVRLFEIQ